MYVRKLTIIGSDNGLSPGRRQSIIWSNAGIMLIGPLGTNISGILIEMYIFSFKKIHFKMSSENWWPFCPCPSVFYNLTTQKASLSTRLSLPCVGGLVAGKAVCEDLCFSADSCTSATGHVTNVNDVTRSSGGSSSGCASLVIRHAIH